jgi:3-oxoacyl-[acyl-carrier protein] reductase
VHYLTQASEAELTLSLVSEAGGQGALFHADIRSSFDVQAMVEAIEHRRGRLDGLVCNAGVAGGKLVVRCQEEEWLRIIDTNLTGAYHCLKAAGSSMVTHGGGSIMLIGSYAGLQGASGQGAYAASKAGLTGLMRTAAREWGPHNIRVNLVCPGWQRTAMVEDLFRSEQRLRDHVLNRPSNLNEIAKTICELVQLSDASGQIWNLDSRIP